MFNGERTPIETIYRTALRAVPELDRTYGHVLAHEAWPLDQELDAESVATLERLSRENVLCSLGTRDGGLPYAHATRLMELGLIWMAFRFVSPVIRGGETMTAGSNWREFQITPHGRDVLAAQGSEHCLLLRQTSWTQHWCLKFRCWTPTEGQISKPPKNWRHSMPRRRLC